MALVGALSVSMSAQTQDFEAGMRRARQEVATTRQLVGEATLSFEGLSNKLTGLAAGALSVGALTAGIRDLVRTGVELQNLRNSFTALTGSASLGRQEFAFVTATANQLGLDIKGLAESYRGLSAASRGTSLEGQGARELFSALSGAARTYGLSTDQTGRALVAFQQIISKGRVAQEELRGKEFAPLAA